VVAPSRFSLLTIAIAAGVALVLSLFSYYNGDSVVLAVSGAKEMTPEQAPQLFNVVQGAFDCRQHPAAARVRHR
jgi:hypothetical protein